MSLQFRDEPPNEVKERYDLVSPEPGVAVRGVMVNQCWLWVPTHFIERRTVPCIGEESNCYGCRLGWIPKWKGYMPILTVLSGRIQVAECPSGAYYRTPAFANRENLRGRELTMRRLGKVRTGRIECEVGTRKIVPEQLCEPVDLRNFLSALWGRQLFYTINVLANKPTF